MTEGTTYTFEPVTVEGADPITPTEDQVADLTAAATEMGLSQEQAQAFAARELTREPQVIEKDPVAPDAYEFAKIKNEAGEEMDAPEDIAKDVAEFAKANGFTQKQAQSVFDRELSLAKEAEEQTTEQVKAMQQEWRDQLSADKDLGGPALEANVAVAKKALGAFFPDLVGSEDKHPFLDHPAVVKGLHKIGTLISDDGDFVPGNANPDPETDRAKTLFPNM